MNTQKHINELTYQVIGASIEVKLLSYMKRIKAPKGILINFNCNNIFKEGQKTFVNKSFRELTNE